MVIHGNYKLKSLELADVPEIKEFTDQWIGHNYYGVEELERYIESSRLFELNASLGIWKEGKLQGIRISLAPGRYKEFIKSGLTASAWPCGPKQMAYFKSLFVAKDSQGLGLGSLLSKESLKILEKMGAGGVLCHSWLESPGNSSQIYLKKFGFQEINRHEKYWYPIDYDCTRCSPKRCVCTASEMVLDLRGEERE
jgi:ribosomal protein S18 acetylase RimI-like enzyme